ncbi:Na+/H+ antiporter [Paenibacillus ginsengihumi]|uniref:Na+/H+ antiporter n=1 Tax=Paenibacillus ginsengihumi TaxID=431596 RepID=UPI000376E63C|nr:Na+/H+ antiporter [Paenibacillus ginsengihumi]
MLILMTVILLLVCLVISNIISHYVPSIPTALTQIALGILIALGFPAIHLEIETEWFLLLFVAPLLYNDGRHFPREELWKMRGSILGNAVVLVLLTTIGGGYFIHWIIPEIPLAAAFALAAILSPTDPVAVNGIAKRIHLPERVLNLVRGESLINDASGLVAFKYAVAAVVTGVFSLREAVFDFTYMFIAGAVLGLLLSLALTWVRFTLRKQGIHDATLHSLLQILSPFVIYIVTEDFLHASGVIAVVVGGIVHALVKERTETMLAEEQMLTENLWSTVTFTLNGIVFLLLGLIIPSSMQATVENPNIGNALAIGYVAAIGFVILAIRFLWSLYSTSYEYHVKKAKDAEKPSVRTSLLVTLTGVRGALTMAGVLSIPLAVASGAAFPERSLILFLAAGVVLFTLVAATVLLPLLSKGTLAEGEAGDYLDLNEAKMRLWRAALKKIKAEMNEDNEAAAYRLIDEYKMQFKLGWLQGSPAHLRQMTEIRLLGLKAERNYIRETMENGGMDEEMFEAFERSLDLREEALSRNVHTHLAHLIGRVLREWRRSSGKRSRTPDKNKRLGVLHQGRDVQLQALQAAVQYLKAHAETGEQRDNVYAVILDYERMIARLKRPEARFDEQMEAQKEQLRIAVMDAERAEIHSLYEAGSISREQARELRRMINSMESVALYEHVE